MDSRNVCSWRSAYNIFLKCFAWIFIDFYQNEFFNFNLISLFGSVFLVPPHIANITITTKMHLFECVRMCVVCHLFHFGSCATLLLVVVSLLKSVSVIYSTLPRPRSPPQNTTNYIYTLYLSYFVRSA